VGLGFSRVKIGLLQARCKMYADLKMLSRVPVDSDLLKRSVRNGANTLILSFSKVVGNGSDRQSLFGSLCTHGGATGRKGNG